MTELLQDYVRDRADAAAADVALVMGDTALTYGDVQESATRLALMLRDSGCRPGDRVCLLASKRPASIVAMLAVLEAGCAYVPVDVASPAPRVALIIASAEPRAVLATADAARLLDELISLRALGAEVALGWLEPEPPQGERLQTAFSERDWRSLPCEPLPRSVGADAMAHILFTSGSTGRPKGVVITHRNVTAFVDWAVAHFGTRPSDRVSGHPPLHFDLSTFDVYGTFAAGAQLHLVPPVTSLTPRGLAEYIRGSELTQWFSVPSALTYMAKFGVVEQNDFPTLERLLWCGEVLPTPVLSQLMTRLPHVRFTNLYGPTEATIASSHHTVTAPPADVTVPVPIGVACDAEELMVLDPDLRPVAPGEIGELYIGGAGLSPGYWRDPERTREAFIPDPRRSDERIYRTGDLARMDDEGLFHFLGRADSQIKSRGYRIELGEIETALNAVDGVRECAVVGVDTDGFEGTAICCAYAAAGEAASRPAALRAELAKVLPSYMLPARWARLDALPKNLNGKIDRRALRERFAGGG